MIARALVKLPYQVEIRQEPSRPLVAGELRLEVAACAVCGTDLHIISKLATDWQPLGHEVSGTVTEVGPGVTRFKVGDRVALDSSAPCGECERCRAGTPLECRQSQTYWGKTMGFANELIAPQQVAFHAGDLPADVASLVEPLGVSCDLVDVADIGPDDRVLIIGPGPLGLLAIPAARARGTQQIWLAGRAHSTARLEAGRRLGATIIETDRTPLKGYDFGPRGVNKILVVAPPPTLLEAIEVGCTGSIIAYIGISFGPEAKITLDADAFHFKRQQLRASMASPGTRGAEALALLRSGSFDPRLVMSHRFALAQLQAELCRYRDTPGAVTKSVMINPASAWVQSTVPG